MAEYIKREAVLAMLDGIYDCNDMVFENDSCAGNDCKSCRWFDTKKYIRKQVEHLNAADVAKVVRCKNCKHRRKATWAKSTVEWECVCDSADPYEQSRHAEDDDWFCADGEAKRGRTDT